MAKFTADEVSMQNSLNSVSHATLTGVDTDKNNVYSRDFTGNDIAFAHTTEEVNRKAHTTQAEVNDQELYFPYRQQLQAVIAEAGVFAASMTKAEAKATLEAAIVEAAKVYNGEIVASASTVAGAVTTLEAALAVAKAAEAAE